VDEVVLDGGITLNRQAILAREQAQEGGQVMPSKKKKGSGKKPAAKKQDEAPAEDAGAEAEVEGASDCLAFGKGHNPDDSDCQQCATEVPNQYEKCGVLTAGKTAARKATPKPKKKVKGKGKGKKAKAEKEPVPEATITKALTLAAKVIKASEGKALSGEQMDQIVSKVDYPGGRGPFRLLLRERGLHPDKGSRRTSETGISAKAVAKYLKG